MDGYPSDVAPEFEEGGAVSTPFNEWWLTAKFRFPNVPEEVAREWLHRHWGHSPFSWIPSRCYAFSYERLLSNRLVEVLSGVHDFEPGGQRALDGGRYLCGDNPAHPWPLEPIWLVKFMKEQGDFPSPIVILDNRNNHLVALPETPERYKDLPPGLILLEGHKRHEIGVYLQAIGQLRDEVQVCRLEFHS